MIGHSGSEPHGRHGGCGFRLEEHQGCTGRRGQPNGNPDPDRSAPANLRVPDIAGVETLSTDIANTSDVQRLRVPDIAGVETLRACWPHDGVAADLIRALKYGRVTAVVTVIAEELLVVAPARFHNRRSHLGAVYSATAPYPRIRPS